MRSTRTIAPNNTPSNPGEFGVSRLPFQYSLMKGHLEYSILCLNRAFHNQDGSPVDVPVVSPEFAMMKWPPLLDRPARQTPRLHAHNAVTVCERLMGII